MDDQLPLCVDLDNTFIKTDLSHEALFKLFKKSPLKSIFFLFSFYRNKADAKTYLSQQITIDTDSIPLNDEVVTYCESEHRTGRKIHLVTGSHEDFANKIAKRFKFFHEVHATKNNMNLIGQDKAAYLIERFGKAGFDYIGDSADDLHVWKQSKNALIVCGKRNKRGKLPNLTKYFFTNKNHISSILKALRPQQWIKNVLIFVPIFLAHRFNDLNLLINAAIGVLAFSLMASSVYLMNDLSDIESDRQHHKKKSRPLASGDISVACGVAIFALCFSTSLLISSVLGIIPFMLLLLYFILNVGYSFSWKKIALLDVFLLTAFYLLRIAFGSGISDIIISPWMRAFSFFLFLSLGFLKRYSEVFNSFHREGRAQIPGRGYNLSDLSVLFSFGSLVGFLSVLVFCQYIFQSNTVKLYTSPDWLWAAAAIIMYWLSSVWFRATKGKVNDDPVIFILKDKQSLTLGFIFLSLVFLAL